MSPWSSLIRIAAASSLLVLLAAACGGQSFTTGNGDDGGTSSGGSSSLAGKATGGSRAGTSSGGNSYAGTSSAGTSSAGAAGGDPGDICSLPPMQPGLPGSCNAYFANWYHDAATGICTPWVYGGCGATQNNFESLEECQQTCPNRAPKYDACQQASDCQVTGPGCCGICDSPSITAHDLIAYNRQYAGSLACGVAAFDAPQGAAPAAPGFPGPVACEPCELIGNGTLKYFAPSCVQGECAVEDLRTSAATACETHTDCRLRNGTACCEGCTAENLIAVRNDGSFEKLVCGDIPQPCPACAPQPPSGAVAVCNQGRCTVAYAAGSEP